MFAALHIPSLPMVGALRVHSASRTLPCAVLAAGPEVSDKNKAKAPLLAINSTARGAGISAGWPLNRALVRCPDLTLLPREPDEETKILEELCLLAETLTPDLEITAPDVVLMDLCRVGKHRASWHTLTMNGIDLWKAAAATPDLAHMAALHPGTRGRTIAAEELRNLPMGMLHLLAGNEPFLPLLELWGLRTLGDFMALPRQDLAERLGSRAGHWHDLLHGKTCRLLHLHRPPDSLAQTSDFEDPVGSLDTVTFQLKRLLHALSARLAVRHVSASRLWFRLRLEGGKSLERWLRLPEPMAETSAMLRPILHLLENITLPQPVTGVDLDAETTSPGIAQQDWYGRQLPRPDRWPETLRKLEALVGVGRVGIPQPSAAHRDDAFTMKPGPHSPDGAATIASSRPLRQPTTSLPLRRYRPPQAVVVASETNGKLTVPLALLAGIHRGPILDRHGPYPSSGAWWDPGASWQRVEWDIELAHHRLLRLAFVPPDTWQLEGSYG